MKKNSIIIVLLLTINIGFSQISNGIITYKKERTDFRSDNKEFELNKEERPNYYNKVLMIDQGTKEILNDIKFLLKFNRDESTFKVKKILEIETNRFFRFAIGPEGSKVYYNNNQEKENLYQVDAFGDLFIVSYPKMKWKLLNETKKIGEYICFKATAIKKVNGKKGIINTPIEAWYCPDLPISFGPLGFNELPGLILELSMKNYKYSVSEIRFNIENGVLIKKPTKGKKVTEYEFKKIGKETMNSYKKEF
jgi:GLPGLI family protein